MAGSKLFTSILDDAAEAALRLAGKEAPAVIGNADPALEVLRQRAAEMELPKAQRTQPSGYQIFETTPEAYNRTTDIVPQESFMERLPRPVVGKSLPLNERLLPILENADDVAAQYASKMAPFQGKNVEYFYHTGPVYEKAFDLLGNEGAGRQFMDRFSKAYAGTSPRTPTDQNLLNSSLLSYKAEQGLPLERPVLNIGGNNDVGYPMISGMHPDLTRRLLAGEDIFSVNPKPSSFAENVRGNLQGVTADTHNIRGILRSYEDLRPGSLPREWFKTDTDYANYIQNGLTPDILSGGINDSLASQTVNKISRQSEYGPMADITARSAEMLGMAPAPTQSLGWFALGDMTNLKSAPKTLTELMGERIDVTAQKLGIDPEATARLYMQGKIPLMNQGGRVEDGEVDDGIPFEMSNGGSPHHYAHGGMVHDADIDAALMTARAEKAGGGGLSKLLSEAFLTLTGKPEREALQELTPAGSGYVAVPGKPTNVDIPLVGKVEARPIGPIEEAAAKYMERIGRPGEHVVDAFPELDKERAAKIAVAYDAMKHDPANPEVRRAYEAMIDETIAQYNALKDLDLDIRFNPTGFDPYAKSPSMGYADLAENRRLWVFPTEQGFGSDVNFDPANNPLLKRVGPVGDLPDATANDLFRVVHDVYGHFAPGNPFFRAPGEERAWLQHSRMYSPEALPAMTSETRGQNSFLNFGPYAKHNATASGADTIYADQKTGLLPSWAYEKAAGGSVHDDDIHAAMMIAQRDHKAGGGSEYGALPSLPYDTPPKLLPDEFTTPEERERGQAVSKAFREGDDTGAILASSYTNEALGNMAAAYNMQKYIQNLTGKVPRGEENLDPYYYTLSDRIRAALPEVGKQNFDMTRNLMQDYVIGIPDFADDVVRTFETGETPSWERRLEHVVNLAPGLVVDVARPALGALKKGYEVSKPILKKAALPVAAGVGMAANSDEAEGSIIGEGAQLLTRDALELAKKMARKGHSMDEIEAATGWYKTPERQLGFADKFGRSFDRMMGFPVDKLSDWKGYIDPKSVQFGQREVQSAPVPFKSMVEWPELDKLYPGLADELQVIPYAREGRGLVSGAYYAPDTKTIALGDVGPDWQPTMMHELQHAIQQKEKFAPGSNVPFARNYYSKLAKDLGNDVLADYISGTDLGRAFYYASPGEVEARNAAFRFANPEFRQHPIRATEDVSSDLLPKFEKDTTMEDLQNVRRWYESGDYLDAPGYQQKIFKEQP